MICFVFEHLPWQKEVETVLEVDLNGGNVHERVS
jgi:hypothetical protein